MDGPGSISSNTHGLGAQRMEAEEPVAGPSTRTAPHARDTRRTPSILARMPGSPSLHQPPALRSSSQTTNPGALRTFLRQGRRAGVESSSVAEEIELRERETQSETVSQQDAIMPVRPQATESVPYIAIQIDPLETRPDRDAPAPTPQQMAAVVNTLQQASQGRITAAEVANSLVNAIGGWGTAASRQASAFGNSVASGAQDALSAGSRFARTTYAQASTGLSTVYDRTSAGLSHAYGQASAGLGRAKDAALEEGGRIVTNAYGDNQAVMGWVANFINAASHELAGTGGATILRELAGACTEALLQHYEVSPESRALGVAVLYTAAGAGNLMAMIHKHHKGVATSDTYKGHAMQMLTLLGTVVAAGALGRGQNGNGQFGLLATQLPNAVKSFVYTARDLFNLELPLESNHDDDYEHPVRAQALNNIPYVPNQYLVNDGQGFFGTSGAGFVDALRDGKLTLPEGMRELTGYVGSNVAGEATDAIGSRLVNELTTHGLTQHAFHQIRDLRIRWSKIDTSEQSFTSQLADKAAGAGIARASLFLNVYGLSAVATHLLSQTSLDDTAKSHLENVLGALLVGAGCVQFAMSTSSQPAQPHAATHAAEA
ncbi:hypothetical protein I6G56_09270 [Burkholderia humptydooensis]|uniref:Uncharacterized protein n=2 Tax=Burkholderia humptydooensis TaxID=430531 RepID=A0A7U4P4M9_9BURK|nr:hypothetical protein BW21_2343 [Burkholderia sp. 2002721687]ALX42899.1 hypothetical protein AQ610_11065 [Burkholderia humptydooensis]QPS45222.1 hypothetical protein I6G56_09270 [Burkholderia humptydooensis]